MDEWIVLVRTQDVGAIREYIESIDLPSLETTAERFTLLSELLLDLRDNDEDILPVIRADIVNMLLAYWDNAGVKSPLARESAVATYLVSELSVSSAAVSYVWIVLNVVLQDVFLDAMKWLADWRIAPVFNRTMAIFTREDVTDVYDPVNNPSTGVRLSDLMTAEEIGALMDFASNRKCDGGYNWFLTYYREICPVINPPPWMIPAVGMDIPPVVIPGNMPVDLREIVSRVIGDSLDLQKEDVITVAEADARLSFNSTRQELYGFTDSRFSSTEQEVEQFKLYGPSNPFTQEDNPGDGQDRMFECVLYDYDEDYDITTDWFTGSCDWMGHRIGDRRFAIREPVETGGWRGCYCSFACLREAIADTSAALDERMLAANTMVDNMQEQLMKYGIYSTVPLSIVEQHNHGENACAKCVD